MYEPEPESVSAPAPRPERFVAGLLTVLWVVLLVRFYLIDLSLWRWAIEAMYEIHESWKEFVARPTLHPAAVIVSYPLLRGIAGSCEFARALAQPALILGSALLAAGVWRSP